MKPKIFALVLSFLGLIILLGTIIYQAKNETSVFFMIPIGTLLSVGGAIAYMRIASKK